MALTVLSARPYCLATRRAAALSQLSPTASSNRLLNGALLGNCSTFSVFNPQLGQRTRYNSITTVVLYWKHGRSRTCRSLTSAASSNKPPQPEQTIFRLPRLRLTHSVSFRVSSSISAWYTAYPGQPNSFVHSLCFNPSVSKTPTNPDLPLYTPCQILAQSPFSTVDT